MHKNAFSIIGYLSVCRVCSIEVVSLTKEGTFEPERHCERLNCHMTTTAVMGVQYRSADVVRLTRCGAIRRCTADTHNRNTANKACCLLSVTVAVNCRLLVTVGPHFGGSACMRRLTDSVKTWLSLCSASSPSSSSTEI
jgi:hypothetical protein